MATTKKKRYVTEDPMLDVIEAAAEINVNTRTIYNWVGTGKPRAYRAGRVIRIRKSDLLAALEDYSPLSDMDSPVPNGTPQTIKANSRRGTPANSVRGP